MQHKSHDQPFCQELPQVKMNDSIFIIARKQRRHGNHELGIIIPYCPQIAEFTFSCRLICNYVGNLHISTSSVRTLTYEIDFSSLQLSYIQCMTTPYKFLTNNIFNNLFDISFPRSSNFVNKNEKM